jgi:hypothetical protein
VLYSLKHIKANLLFNLYSFFFFFVIFLTCIGYGKSVLVYVKFFFFFFVNNNGCIILYCLKSL